jgi:hypothetical protein
VYRPHPRSGVVDPVYKAAHERIVTAIDAANQQDPAAHHIYDAGPDLGWQLAAADVAITDISAMVYDRLATGKPLLIARPVSPDADVDLNGYLGSAEWVTADEAPEIVGLVDRVLHDESARERLDYWAHRHFGDTTEGEATCRFGAAVDQLVARWQMFDHEHPVDSGARSKPADSEGCRCHILIRHIELRHKALSFICSGLIVMSSVFMTCACADL